MFRKVLSNIRVAIILILVVIGIAIVLFRPQDHTGGPIPGTSKDVEVQWTEIR